MGVSANYPPQGSLNKDEEGVAWRRGEPGLRAAREKGARKYKSNTCITKVESLFSIVISRTVFTPVGVIILYFTFSLFFFDL